MSAQAPQSTDIRTRSGEEQRFREAVNRQVPRPGPGMVHTTVPGGTVMRTLRQGARSSTAANFRVSRADVGEEKRIRVSNGQLGGITPTLAGGAALDTVPAPTAVITGTGTEYVYAVSEVTHTSTLDYVHNSVIDAIDIQIFTSIRPDDLTGTYYKLLATLVNGVVQRPQPVSTSLNVNFSDDGTASSQAVASYPRA